MTDEINECEHLVSAAELAAMRSRGQARVVQGLEELPHLGRFFHAVKPAAGWHYVTIGIRGVGFLEMWVADRYTIEEIQRIVSRVSISKVGWPACH